MSKITIIGLGLVGNSIGMALKRSNAQRQQGADIITITGFDPSRDREALALRKYYSVDNIAPNLKEAVQGARMVIVATPADAVEEVLSAIDPFLEEGATVTDTLGLKEPVLAQAAAALGKHVSFIGGHPFSTSLDVDAAPDDTAPDPELFKGAAYCIMPLPSARNEALNSVISLAEMLGARPLFMDPHEHDSIVAAISHLPVLSSAALWALASSSPSWDDMRSLAQARFESATEPLSSDPAQVAAALQANRRFLLGWLDRYLLALQDLRDILAAEDEKALAGRLTEAAEGRSRWLTQGRSDDARDAELRAELRQHIQESRPGRAMLGGYLADRIFKKKEKERN